LVTSHAGDAPVSPWVRRFLPLFRSRGTVLDLAAGRGRHSALLAAAGFQVEAVDRDPDSLAALRDIAGVKVTAADLEGAAWPFSGRLFDGIVVTNYLWRPLLDVLAASLSQGGMLVYETFRIGNEKFGRPSNPDFLLRQGELLEFARAAGLEVVAFESGHVELPRPAVVECICARRPAADDAPAALARTLDPPAAA
jgi:SAM-dependent methyltransferase